MGVVYSLFEQPLLPRKVLEEARRHLVRQRVEVPGYDVFLRIITDQYNVYGRKLSGQLDQFLTLTHRQVLDELVQQEETCQRPLIQQFKTVDQAQKPKAIKASLALFKKISNYFEQVEPAVRQPHGRPRRFHRCNPAPLRPPNYAGPNQSYSRA